MMVGGRRWRGQGRRLCWRLCRRGPRRWCLGLGPWWGSGRGRRSWLLTRFEELLSARCGDHQLPDAGYFKGAKTYARKPFLFVPHALFLRHRSPELANSTDDGGDSAFVRAGFEKQFSNILRLAVTHCRGYREVVERFFRYLLTRVFDVPVRKRGDAGGE